MAQKETQSRSQENIQRGQSSQSSTPGQIQNRESRTDLARRGSNLPGFWGGSPFTFMRRFSEQMDRLFDDFGFGTALGPSFGRGFGEFGDLARSMWSPQVEIFQGNDKLVVRADLPGLTKDDINVELLDDAIIIRGERKQEHEEDEEGYYRSERSYGSFYRRILLPEGVNTQNAEANFRDGVLEITMAAPKKEETKARRLEIRGVGEEKAKTAAAGSSRQ